MLESASGIILRTRLLTETSLIVVWLTLEQGRISTVAKGARRVKSPFLGKLDLFYEADFTFQRSRRSDLHTLRELALKETHATLREDLGCLRQGSYFTTLVEATTEIDTPIPGIYALLKDAVRVASTAPPRPETLFAFELKLLSDLGMAPDFSQTRLSPGTVKVAQALQSESWDFIGRIRTNQTQVTELKQFLHGYLIYHLDKLPSGRELAIG